MIKIPSNDFLGYTIRSCATSNLTLSETIYRSGVFLAPHSHELTLCFILSGNFTESYKTRSSELSPGTLIFRPCGEIHTNCFHSETRCFNIQVDRMWFRQLNQDSNIFEVPGNFQEPQLSFLAARLYAEFCEFDLFSPMAIEGISIELLALTARRALKKTSATAPNWLLQIREILFEQFDKTLTLSSLSETAGVHPTHLAREFRRHYKCSVGEFVRRRRVEIALDRIANSNSSLAGIALDVGFFDQSHFAKVFKSQTGMTPREYRKSTR